jgi:drug/metabolite transporter (DMT)-like permease
LLCEDRTEEVFTMAGTTGQRSHILNSDGQPHPVENVLTIFTLVVGLVSFVLGMIVRNVPSAGTGVTITATATGLISMLVGLYAQMISATREQRVLIVTGIIAGFVGMALGLGHGGFTA